VFFIYHLSFSSYHLSLYVKFKGIPQISKDFQKDGKLTNWNTNKENGWKQYLEQTTDNEVLDDLANNAEKTDSSELMDKITKVMNKVKFKCFGEVKISHGSSRNKRLEGLYKLKSKAVNESDDSEINQIESQIKEELLMQQKQNFENKLKCLDNMRNQKGNSAAIFKLKEQILGSKKTGPEAVSMEDPETGLMIVEKESLKKASVKYVSTLLTNRSPKEEYKREFEIMENLHNLRTAEHLQNDAE
jgi:hypothetical protein